MSSGAMMSRLGIVRSVLARAVLAGAACVAGTSAAFAEGSIDLRVKEAPQRELFSLAMRTAATKDSEVSAKTDEVSTPPVSGTDAASSRLDNEAIPTEYSDLR
ncbi:MAG: hypothetical protein GY811_22860 [Myxococcales bacterium]|nr:hypothetical protein [Myxococcales bacterium]